LWVALAVFFFRLGVALPLPGLSAETWEALRSFHRPDLFDLLDLTYGHVWWSGSILSLGLLPRTLTELLLPEQTPSAPKSSASPSPQAPPSGSNKNPSPKSAAASSTSSPTSTKVSASSATEAPFWNKERRFWAVLLGTSLALGLCWLFWLAHLRSAHPRLLLLPFSLFAPLALLSLAVGTFFVEWLCRWVERRLALDGKRFVLALGLVAALQEQLLPLCYSLPPLTAGVTFGAWGAALAALFLLEPARRIVSIRYRLRQKFSSFKEEELPLRLTAGARPVLNLLVGFSLLWSWLPLLWQQNLFAPGGLFAFFVWTFLLALMLRYQARRLLPQQVTLMLGQVGRLRVDGAPCDDLLLSLRSIQQRLFPVAFFLFLTLGALAWLLARDLGLWAYLLLYALTSLLGHLTHLAQQWKTTPNNTP